MAHPFTFPTLFDECKQLSIAILKKYEYLKPKQLKVGIIHWKLNEQPSGSISLRVDTTCDEPFVELNYKYQEKPICYRVSLVIRPSNLGKGFIWSFICPKTGKRTRILYCIDGYFLHREAFQGCMYKCQTYSKRGRKMARYFKYIEATEQINSRYCKTHYRGKPTKRYLQHLQIIYEVNQFSFSDMY